MKKLRIGAVNWDCSLPPETYFGYYQTHSLSPKKFRTVTPYYADVLDEDTISYHLRTQAEFDREMAYALDAGIDYFAYVWYGEEASRNNTQSKPSVCSPYVHELTYARKMHVKSQLKEQLSMCAIAGAHPFSEGDLKELAMTMQEPFYEKVDGRPLLYVFGGCRMDFITAIREMCEKLGCVLPYVVPLCSPEPDEKFSDMDALSAYTLEVPGVDRYAELSKAVIADNERRRLTGLPVIPLYSVGWDPSPRVERPCPWYGYEDTRYMRFASEEELLEGAKELVEWINQKARPSFVGHILTFAWNEFEEGGMICPLLDENGNIDTSRLTAFSRVVECFRRDIRL